MVKRGRELELPDLGWLLQYYRSQVRPVLIPDP